MLSENPHLIYRPDIDGLRAIAVALVILYHVFGSLLPGGFIGVDVFFVISGFLITSIILKDLGAGKFTFKNFYNRRFTRIAPALIVVLLATWIASRHLLLGDVFQRLGSHLIASAAFFQNMLLYTEAGYFDASSLDKPLLHLWSLSIEEQFYLFWPLLIVLISKLPLRFTLIALIAICLGSFWINIYLQQAAPIAGFYMLPPRLWELMLGGILAYLTARNRLPTIPSWLRHHNWSFAPLALLVGGLFSDADNFPGWMALFPTLSAVWFIAQGESGLFNRMVANKLFVYLGKISYPLYLWHWPIYVLARNVFPESHHTVTGLFVVVSSLFLSDLTWRFIEQPGQRILRSLGDRRWLNAITLGSSGLILAGFVGWLTHKGFAYTKDQAQVASLTAYKDYKAEEDPCFMGKPEQGVKDIPLSCVDKISRDSIVLWGDSASSHYWPGVRKFFANESPIKMPVYSISGSQCAPVLDLIFPDRPNCLHINKFIFDQIVEKKPRFVVISALWIIFFRAAPYYNHDPYQKLAETLQKLADSGVEKIFLVGEPPMYSEPLYKILAKRKLNGLEFEKIESLANLTGNIFKTEDSLRALIKSQKVIFVPLLKAFCNVETCDTFVTYGGRREIAAYDVHHLTATGSDYVGSIIGKTINLSATNKVAGQK